VSGQDGGGGSAGAAGTDPCPLTAEEVTAALGATVENDGTGCSFYPPDEGTNPRAVLVRLPPLACEDVEATGLAHEPYDGLGVDAYLYSAPAVPARILVCTDAPFDLSTEIAGDEAASRAATEGLARLVLEGG